MPKKKTTAWLRFGRSGDTVDGRIINDQDIQQAAESYDPNFYTALIWPDHSRWYNLGKVVAARAEENDEGGWDLFGKIEANDIYKSINAAGQRLFTSMELFPNFRKSGKTYLSGLGATDSPASVATSEVHLSQVESKDVLVAQYYEAVSQDFDDSETATDDKSLKKALAKLLFSNQTDSEEDDMSAALLKLQGELKSLKQELSDLKAKGTGGDEQPEKTPLEKQVIELSQQVTTLTEKLDKGIETPPKDEPPKDEKYAELENTVTKLSEKLSAALQEQPGTNGGEHDGDGKDLSECI